MKLRENLSLYIGILIPVLMVIFVAMSIYVPKFLSDERPQHDFLYMTGRNVVVEDGLRTEYFVRDNRLQKVKQEISRQEAEPPSLYRTNAYERPVFYLYDLSEKEAHSISFEEASNLQLDPSMESPDGFEVISSRQNGVFFFGFDGGYDNKRFLKGNYYSEELNLKYSNSDFYNFQFLGWIIRE